MANYCCATRTNYFHVKDEGKFRDLMSRVYGSEDEVRLWEEKDIEGKTVFGFGCYGGIGGLRNPLTDENEDDIYEGEYDEFIDILQTCVADNDAVIIMESGNEKLRYVIGSATVVTSHGYEYLDVAELAISKVREALGDSGWTTKCDY